MQFFILELQISHLTNPRLGSEESEVASTGHTVVTGKSTIGTRQHRAIKIFVEKAQKIAQTQDWYQSTEIAHHNAWSLEPIFSSTVNRHSDLFICFAEVLQKVG